MNAAKIVTVTGPIAPDDAGVTDAHNHVWIAAVAGAAPDAPVLDEKQAILAELRDYRASGGGTIIDCQPGGCGRDGRVLRELSAGSGVDIVASTGYHRRKYYPPAYWLFQATTNKARAYFVDELTQGLTETRESDQPVRAGCIKIACERRLDESPRALMTAAAQASVETGAAIEIHTERGASAEQIVTFMADAGVDPSRLVLCHMDKRADIELHRALAHAGVMLEYDTFYRPKYTPEENLWPLLEQMIADGLASQVALATDMADAGMWTRIGGGPGLTGLFTQIRPRLAEIGVPDETIAQLIGENIAIRLARPS